MRLMRQLAALVSDECGGESTEYALVCGLIIVAALAIIGKLGAKVLVRWNSVNGIM
jgi:Flp pilus assembly pilin Flp